MNKAILFCLFLLLLGNLHAFNIQKEISHLQSYDCKSCADLSHEILQMSWPISDIPLRHNIKNRQVSRNYQIQVSLKQLRKGVPINTMAPGAIVRISPVNNNLHVKPTFRLRNQQGVNLSLMEASAMFAQNKALHDTYFTDNTLAIAELKPEIGSGEFIISGGGNDKMNENELYQIHVFDRNAPISLSIETNKTHYFRGHELTTTVFLGDNVQNYPIDEITLSLINPQGETIPLAVTSLAANIYQAKTILNAEKDSQEGNWYVKATVISILADRIILRQAHSAFSYVIPSAAITDIMRNDPNEFNFSATVDVATESRYALQAVLFGSDKHGNIHPLQTVQSAAWFSIGQHNLNFSFNSTIKTNYKAPYYLGYIHLTDFGQMKPVFEFDTPIPLTQLS